MSRIDELVERRCPEGVEYRPLGEVAVVERGVRVTRNQLSTESGYPVYQNALKPLGFHTKTNFPAGTAFVIGAGAAGEIGYSNEEFWAADDCYPVVCGDALEGRYVYHALLNLQPCIKAQVRKASIPRLSRTVIERLRIPVPPMEVQEEVVRVLDSFAELEAELEAELAARRLQYAYYRDQLLDFTEREDVPWLTLGEVGKTFTGSTPSKKHHSFYGGRYPFYKPGDYEFGQSIATASETLTLEGLAAARAVEEDSILVTCIGATLGKVGYVCKQGACNQQINVIAPFESANPRFVFHLCCSRIVQRQIEAMASYSSMPILNLSKFKAISIPLPPLAEQERIVAILDRFDALTTSLADGLPAEIETRRKQYAHYRDRLLAFPERTCA